MTIETDTTHPSDAIPVGIRLISHEEVNRKVDHILGPKLPDWVLRIVSFLQHLGQK